MWRLQTRSIPPKRRRSSRLFEMFLLWHYGSVPLFISLPYEGYSKFITHLIFNNGSKRKIDLIFVCMYFGLKLLQFAGCGLCKLIFEIARLVAFRFCVACILYIVKIQGNMLTLSISLYWHRIYLVKYLSICFTVFSFIVRDT